jgi:tRNA threonylcarbamoyladenosine biosynthesis protein TsaB
VLTLALDTATRQGRFALAAGPALLGYRPHNVTGRHADGLLPVVDLLLAGAGRRLDEVSLVAVTDGPGSFTGVRLGVATAKTLAWALGAELAAVSTLAAMAADLLAEHPGRELAVPVLDARRGEVFAALYRRAGGWVEAVLAPACLPPDAWWRTLTAALADLDAPVFGGEGVALLVQPDGELRPELTARGAPAARAWQAAHPATARALALALAEPALRSPGLGLAVRPGAAVPAGRRRRGPARDRRDADAPGGQRRTSTAAAAGRRTVVNETDWRIRTATAADLVAVDRIERASFGDPWSPAALLQELSVGACACRWWPRRPARSSAS